MKKRHHPDHVTKKSLGQITGEMCNEITSNSSFSVVWHKVGKALMRSIAGSWALRKGEIPHRVDLLESSSARESLSKAKQKGFQERLLSTTSFSPVDNCLFAVFRKLLKEL